MRRIVAKIKEGLTRKKLGVPLIIWLLCLLTLLWLAWFLAQAPKPWQDPNWDKFLAKEQLNLKSCIVIGLWLGAAFNLAALLVLTAALPLLARWTRLPPHPQAPETLIIPRGPSPRNILQPLSLAGLAVILIFGLVLRLPSLPDTIHRDEQDTLRRNTFGFYEEQKDGTFKFKKRKWRDVLWENNGANNPVFYSICQRLCLEAAWKHGNLPREQFSVTAVRLPSLVAGLLSIAAIWFLLMALGIPEGAWVAALVAAMHPMHVDYSAEGRGYGFVLLFTVLQVIFLIPALRNGRWHWWAGYGLSQFLLLYSNPGSLYFPLVLNVALLGILAWRWWTSRGGDKAVNAPRRTFAIGQFWRLLVANALSAMSYIMLMGPCIPQILNYFKITSVRGEMGALWLFQVGAQYTTGIFLILQEKQYEDARYLSQYIRNEFAPAQPMVTPWIFYIMPIFLVLGLIGLWRRGLVGRLVGICAFLPPILCYLHHQKITGLYLFYWYVIFGLPFLIVAWGVGMTLPFKSLAYRMAAERQQTPGRPWKALWMLVPILLMPLYFMATQQGRAHLRTPMAPVTEILRGRNIWQITQDGRMYKLRPRPGGPAGTEHTPMPQNMPENGALEN